MMFVRTSVVDHLKVDALSHSSVAEIGDSAFIHCLSRALAVKREEELFFTNEGSFRKYDVFSMPIPMEPIVERMTMQTTNLKPIIKVNNIDILGASAASVIHIGSSKHIAMEARVKHIRQLKPDIILGSDGTQMF